MSTGTGASGLVSDAHDFELEDIKYTGNQQLSDYFKRRVPRDDDFWQKFEVTVFRLAEKLEKLDAAMFRFDYKQVCCARLILLTTSHRVARTAWNPLEMTTSLSCGAGHARTQGFEGEDFRGRYGTVASEAEKEARLGGVCVGPVESISRGERMLLRLSFDGTERPNV